MINDDSGKFLWTWSRTPWSLLLKVPSWLKLTTSLNQIIYWSCTWSTQGQELRRKISQSFSPASASCNAQLTWIAKVSVWALPWSSRSSSQAVARLQLNRMGSAMAATSASAWWCPSQNNNKLMTLWRFFCKNKTRRKKKMRSQPSATKLALSTNRQSQSKNKMFLLSLRTALSHSEITKSQPVTKWPSLTRIIKLCSPELLLLC